MRQEFETADPELAHHFLVRAYADSRMSLNAVPHDVHLHHSRYDAGLFNHDLYANSMDVHFAGEPLGTVLVALVRRGRIERESDGVRERLGAGDVYLVAEPDRGYTCSSPGVQVEIIGLDRAVLGQVTGRAPDRLRFAGLRPHSPAATLQWHHTLDHVANGLLANPEAAGQPLVVGSTARLLAATVLATFPTGEPTEPTAADRRDAHPATIRRAVAYLEQQADQDVGLADIAAAAHVSPRAVQHAFRRHLGTTPLGYLRRIRLERAHRDLLAADPDGGDTVSAIALRWGFASHSRFTAHYRTAYGRPPSHTLRT